MDAIFSKFSNPRGVFWLDPPLGITDLIGKMQQVLLRDAYTLMLTQIIHLTIINKDQVRYETD